MPGMRSGRDSPGAVRRKTPTLTGTIRYVMMVAIEITSASGKVVYHHDGWLSGAALAAAARATR